MARSWPQNAIEIETLQPISSKKWSQVTITYDGKGTVNGIQIYINGKKTAVKRKGDENNRFKKRISKPYFYL